MTDARLKGTASLEGVTMDLLLLDTGLLDEREELATSARVALGTDAMSSKGDVLPDLDSTDRRGWWGDFEAKEIWGGWPIGCKNWLLTRAKITQAPSLEGSTINRAKNYTLTALQPFVDKQIASQIAAVATQIGLERIDVEAKIYRGPAEEIDLRYQVLWEQEPVVVEDSEIEKVVLPDFLALRIKTASPTFGTPVFLTKSPVHLPSKGLTVSSPVVKLPVLGPTRFPANSFTLASPEIGRPIFAFHP